MPMIFHNFYLLPSLFSLYHEFPSYRIVSDESLTRRRKDSSRRGGKEGRKEERKAVREAGRTILEISPRTGISLSPGSLEAETYLNRIDARWPVCFSRLPRHEHDYFWP